MVNPYALASRQQNKNQVQLGQSQALKKFEKFQQKHTQSIEKSRNTNKKKKDKSFSLDDSISIDQDDEDEEEDSFFKDVKKNKFMKAKREKSEAEENKQSEEEEEEESNKTELEISVNDRSSTPNRKSSLNQKSTSRVFSAASSLSSFKNLPKRSPSRVKFLKQDEDDESTISEDILSKNLLLDIQDLEPASVSSSPTKLKRKSKSPISRRSESVASIIEEDESEKNNISSLTASIASPSILDANLILDIKELEKSLSELSVKKKDKKSKKSKKTSIIETETELKTAESSILTEVDSEKTKLSKKKHKSKSKSESDTSIKNKKSYIDDFEETDMDQESSSVYSTSTTKTKTKTKSKIKKVYLKTTETQVDTTDLLKHSDLIKNVNTFNPSSLVLATVTYLNDASTLKDLNQLTGYNLINQTFNDLIKMNLNFMKNFLNTQRLLYEQQIQSIQPK